MVTIVKNLRSLFWKSFLLSFIFFHSCQKKQEPNGGRSLENALKTFELEEGFQIELIAGEPLISDPVDMEIDEWGRLYVVEMHGYPLDLSGSGRIKLLTDTDGDGIMDKSTVFADGLMLPTGIMRWKNGVLVTDPPHVLYLEDSDGDGKADKKEIVLKGFALSNPQHNVNSPRLGLDNWIYLGHEPAVSTSQYVEEFGDKGSEIFYPGKPDGKRLPQNAGGRSIRFRPDQYELEVLASRTQFGHTFDPWGRRFVVNNNNHIIHDVIAARYLDRNPYLVVSSSTQSISDHGDAAEVFPITINPEHQLLTDVGVMTSACGITAYLGAAFPEPYKKAVFVAEPVSNLVHIDFVSDQNTSFIASRQHSDREFLASTDAWFRPVNMYIGPDGALYVVDYYRQIIEHPEWMAEEVVNSGALYNGTGQGRIYRITPSGTKPLDWSNKLGMGNYSIEQLIEKLDNPNIWWRRNAQRLILDRKPADPPKELGEMAANKNAPLGRIHALWALEGLGKITYEVIADALKDREPGVRENAIKIAELHLNSFPQLPQDLIRLKSDPDPKVRFQLLCTLGFVKGPAAAQARKEVLLTNLDDPWMQVAALSAPYEESRGLMEEVLLNFKGKHPGYEALLQRLSAMIGSSLDQAQISSLVYKGIAKAQGEDASWQAPLLKGLAQGMRGKKIDGITLRSLEVPLMRASMEHSSLQVRQASFQLLQVIGLSENTPTKAWMEKALIDAGNRNLAEEERMIGINLLSFQDAKPYESHMRELVKPHEPVNIQMAAIKSLSNIPGNSVAHFIIGNWDNLTPEIRDEALQTLMANDDRMRLLLSAMEEGKIQSRSLGWGRSVRLMNHSNEQIRKRARWIINKEEGKGEEVLQRYLLALDLKASKVSGKAVYQNNCAVCHQMGKDLGQTFGPDLATLKNRRPENILSDILLPGLSIADGYDLWSIELQNGEKLQGLIASETPTAILLRSAAGYERSVSRQDIKSIQVLNVSAMPEGLENNISLQEMADLIAFIRNVK